LAGWLVRWLVYFYVIAINPSQTFVRAKLLPTSVPAYRDSESDRSWENVLETLFGSLILAFRVGQSKIDLDMEPGRVTPQERSDPEGGNGEPSTEP
jgi:hypothetical protein